MTERIEYIRQLREQARTSGLRFNAYLPADLADWLLGVVEDGVFADPSEAVFVILGEYRDVAPHDDLREELLRRLCQAALDDPRPRIPHHEMVERMRELLAAPRPEPAVWRKTP